MPSGRLSQLLTIVALLAASLGSAACVNNPGINPTTRDVFFPTGLALDPRAPVLYVTNANADIMYNGGTLVALDLDEYHCRREGTCEGGGTCSGGPCCIPDARNPSWLDCDEQLIRTDADGNDHLMVRGAVRIGSYAQEPVVNSAGTRLYVPVRGDPSITYVELRRDGYGFPEMECGDTGEAEGPPTCDTQHRVQGRGDILPMPGEPFFISLDERKDLQEVVASRDATGGDDLAVELLYVAHLTTGEVSVFCAPQDGSKPPELMYVVSNLFMPNANQQQGTTAVVRQPNTETLYATSRTNAYVATIGRYTDLPLDNRCDPASYQYAAGGQISLASLDTGTDSRGIAFAPDGSRAFVTQRQPSSVVVVNTGADGIGASERIAPLMPIEVCDEPSIIRVRETPEQGLLVYVVCFADRSVFVIDPDLGQVVDTIPVPDGPYSLALDPPGTARPYGYLANFRENTIAVLDLDPNSPTYHQVVGLIGSPEVTQ